MAIEHPSEENLKLFGKFLFYALIIPALCYYVWAGLSALFSWLTSTPTNTTHTILPPIDNEKEDIIENTFEYGNTVHLTIRNDADDRRRKPTGHKDFNPILEVDIEPDATIADLKQSIESEYGISVKAQQLFLNGSKLQDNQKIRDYRINDTTVLHLSDNTYKFRVKLEDGSMLKEVEVPPDATVADLKRIIQDRTEIPAEFQQLSLLGGVLEDKWRIEDCEINHKTVFTLEAKPLHVTVIKGSEAIKFEVRPDATIDDLKLIIESSDGIARETQTLKSQAGKNVLQGNQRIYDIKGGNETVLHLDVTPRDNKKSFFSVNVTPYKIYNQKSTRNILVSDEETVDDVKRKYECVTKTPHIKSDKRLLYFGNQQLADCSQLKNHKEIKEGANLNIANKIKYY